MRKKRAKKRTKKWTKLREMGQKSAQAHGFGRSKSSFGCPNERPSAGQTTTSWAGPVGWSAGGPRGSPPLVPPTVCCSGAHVRSTATRDTERLHVCGSTRHAARSPQKPEPPWTAPGHAARSWRPGHARDCAASPGYCSNKPTLPPLPPFAYK